MIDKIEVEELENENSEEGATMIEYALLVALIAIIAIAAIKFAGTKVSEQFSKVGDSLS